MSKLTAHKAPGPIEQALLVRRAQLRLQLDRLSRWFWPMLPSTQYKRDVLNAQLEQVALLLEELKKSPVLWLD